ncbi:hypothetical protein Pint_18824 [Pistacia integerrima]|uniref:Uncharacterized protein n=1 Tax=Pistacia integerrima TaxID=434235 RepID=A0ACC0YZF5_9ROSI|nr:hypothetical protein Pint_18824 [Pistacia integerrima]
MNLYIWSSCIKVEVFEKQEITELGWCCPRKGSTASRL